MEDAVQQIFDITTNAIPNFQFLVQERSKIYANYIEYEAFEVTGRGSAFGPHLDGLLGLLLPDALRAAPVVRSRARPLRMTACPAVTDSARNHSG